MAQALPSRHIDRVGTLAPRPAHAVAALALALATCGCSNQPRAHSASAPQPAAPAPSPISATAPDDFTLGVTIIPPTSAPARGAGTVDVWARPARYIVEPDGTFRAALAPPRAVPDGTPASLMTQELPQATVPPIVRVLSRQQLEDVYQSVRGSGFLIMPHGAAVSSAQTYVGRDRVIVLLSTLAQGRRQSIALSASDPGAKAISERLAALAWMDRP